MGSRFEEQCKGIRSRLPESGLNVEEDCNYKATQRTFLAIKREKLDRKSKVEPSKLVLDGDDPLERHVFYNKYGPYGRREMQYKVIMLPGGVVAGSEM